MGSLPGSAALDGVCTWTQLLSPDAEVTGQTTRYESNICGPVCSINAGVQINQLKELTNSHLLRESQLFRVDWKTVATILNREQNDCKFKFKELFQSELKTGPFTPEEDAQILARVRETGDGIKFRPGFWAMMGKELNRSSSTVIFRWKKTLCHVFENGSL